MNGSRGACAVSLHFRKYNAVLLVAVVVVTPLTARTQGVGAMHRKQRNIEWTSRRVERRTDGMVGWRRRESAAAVMVFLFGATLSTSRAEIGHQGKVS